MKKLKKKIEDLIFSFEVHFGWFFINGRKQDDWSEKLRKKKQERDGSKEI